MLRHYDFYRLGFLNLSRLIPLTSAICQGLLLSHAFHSIVKNNLVSFYAKGPLPADTNAMASSSLLSSYLVPSWPKNLPFLWSVKFQYCFQFGGNSYWARLIQSILIGLHTVSLRLVLKSVFNFPLGLLIVSSLDFTIKILSRERLTTDGVWTGNRIYCTLTTRDYKYL
jgi:hypothetical protein